jgi:hypothetical protein
MNTVEHNGQYERKPRFQGTLSRMSEDARACLHRWLRDGLTYKEIAGRCRAELDTETSVGALCNYYKRYHAKIMRKPFGARRPDARTIQLEVTLLLEIAPDGKSAQGHVENLKVVDSR